MKCRVVTASTTSGQRRRRTRGAARAAAQATMTGVEGGSTWARGATRATPGTAARAATAAATSEIGLWVDRRIPPPDDAGRVGRLVRSGHQASSVKEDAVNEPMQGAVQRGEVLTLQQRSVRRRDYGLRWGDQDLGRLRFAPGRRALAQAETDPTGALVLTAARDRVEGRRRDG